MEKRGSTIYTKDRQRTNCLFINENTLFARGGFIKNQTAAVRQKLPPHHSTFIRGACHFNCRVSVRDLPFSFTSHHHLGLYLHPPLLHPVYTWTTLTLVCRVRLVSRCPRWYLLFVPFSSLSLSPFGLLRIRTQTVGLDCNWKSRHGFCHSAHSASEARRKEIFLRPQFKYQTHQQNVSTLLFV